MEGINIQIEPCKTYFSDGCVETVGTDETDLLRGESKTNSIESVSIIVLPALIWYLCMILLFESID